MKKSKNGFSLIEIIIFCFIAVTLLMLFVGLAFNSREFSRTMGCINNMKNLSQAIENFQADNRETPRNLADLYPNYITDNRTFKCPADRTSDTNSYERFYIGRFFAEEDGQKVFLVCPRHNRGNKTVGAYLSYAVDIGKNSNVLWSGLPATFGEVYTGGTLQFVDGTTVEINSGKLGLLASFTDNEGKLYHIIYTLEGEEGNFTVDHQGNSRFEVITPAVIAGVEGTKFTVRNTLKDTYITSSITVLEGLVKVQDRSQDSSTSVVKPNQIKAVSVVNELTDSVVRKKGVPRKPKKH
ncbi:MAG: FecR domain-containing protein [Candidatus Omnitrophica bacterium]|nr:FecR domain-containing protein [Candidatus Omnitrophota bacterium]